MKERFKLDSLRKKVLLYVIVVIVLCAIVSAFSINLVVSFQMRGLYGTEKEAAIESLSNSIGPMLGSSEDTQIKQVISSYLIFDNIDYIAVYDNAGTLIASGTQDNVTSQDFKIETHEIRSGGTSVGSYEIGFSQQYINTLVQRTTLVLITSLVVFLFLVGLALFIFLGRAVIQPIETIARYLRALKPGNLKVRMNIETNDEIGVLAANFNQMAGDLQRSYAQVQSARDELEQKVELRTKGERRRADQLKAINEVDRRISAILSLDELLPYVVSSLQKAFDYYNVRVFLLDRGQGGVVLKAAAGEVNGGASTGLLICLNAGVVGRVAATGIAYGGDIGEAIEGVLQEEASRATSELAVPIKIGNEILGVLDIQSLEVHAFDEIDLFTAQTLGDQLGIAIENARLYQEGRDIAVLEERNRMAREIHDTLAQGFTGIILQLEAAEQSLRKYPDHAQEHLNRARVLARESLNEARRSVWDLRPKDLETLTLIETLRQQVGIFSRETGVSADFEVSGSVGMLSQEIENALLRIFQESMVNIKKHAEASNVKIDIRIDGQAVILRISDNGVGFENVSSSGRHFGLIGMRERAKLLGGSIDIRSEKGKGTHIEVMLPMDRGTI